MSTEERAEHAGSLSSPAAILPGMAATEAPEPDDVETAWDLYYEATRFKAGERYERAEQRAWERLQARLRLFAERDRLASHG